MNPDKWTPDDVAAHLYEIGLGKYGTVFVDSNISGRSLFTLTDKDLRDLGFSAANRTTFNSWVESLHRPRASKALDAGRRIASPKSTISSRNQLSTSQNVKKAMTPSKNASNRLFTASLQKKKPTDEYVEYRPRITGAMRYGGQVDDSFDIRDLMFAPPPQVKQLPKRILPPGSKSRRKTKFDVPEEGDCDNRGQCRYCGRKFALDRLPVHESICARCSKPKRRPFNSQRQRISYNPSAYGKLSSRTTKNSTTPKRRPGEKPKYVQEHEELIRALRAARMAESGASYGMKQVIPKYSSSNSKGSLDGRVQCPYCGRRFGKEQAERHIRFCQNNLPAPRGPMTTCKVARGGTYRH